MKPNIPSSLIAACLCFSTVGDSEETQPSPEISVQIFVIPDCPIVNRYAPEINRIHNNYSDKSVKIILVYPGKALTAEDIATHREEYSLTPAGILDPDYKMVKRAGATITPEAVVFDRTGKIVYRGRIDNWFTDYGDRRREASERNLRLALEAVLAGKEVKIKQAPAIGCFIET